MINILKNNLHKLCMGLTIDEDFIFESLELRNYNKFAMRNKFYDSVGKINKIELEQKF